MTATASTTWESVLAPSEYLVMEALAARWRLGESGWTFPSYNRRTLAQLAERGLINWKDGVAGGCLAWFTDQGRVGWGLDRPYPTPTDRALDREAEGNARLRSLVLDLLVLAAKHANEWNANDRDAYAAIGAELSKELLEP